ncbi:MAG: hypothetical protein AAGF12_09520 [Myxococcota bacterium]
MNAFLAALTGMVAGSAHVVTGPDHLAAVLPLAAGSGRRAAILGALWGFGHGLAVLALGFVGRFVVDLVAIETISAVSELVVGVLLVGLGVFTLRRSRLLVVHAHTHVHDEAGDEAGSPHEPGEHQHIHVHIGDKTVGTDQHVDAGDHKQHRHSALGFGALHGAAGAGHLFGVLPSLALSAGLAAVYLLTYFLGAIVAMTLFALLVGVMTRSPRHLPRVMVGAGAISLLVGLFWIGSALA